MLYRDSDWSTRDNSKFVHWKKTFLYFHIFLQKWWILIVLTKKLLLVYIHSLLLLFIVPTVFFPQSFNWWFYHRTGWLDHICPSHRDQWASHNSSITLYNKWRWGTVRHKLYGSGAKASPRCKRMQLGDNPVQTRIACPILILPLSIC